MMFSKSFAAFAVISAAFIHSSTLVANDSSDKSRLVGANNEFAFSLYRRVIKHGDNIFFSPYSISTALSMTYAGASGETAEQMRKTLCFPNGLNVHQAFANLAAFSCF